MHGQTLIINVPDFDFTNLNQESTWFTLLFSQLSFPDIGLSETVLQTAPDPRGPQPHRLPPVRFPALPHYLKDWPPAVLCPLVAYSPHPPEHQAVLAAEAVRQSSTGDQTQWFAGLGQPSTVGRECGIGGRRIQWHESHETLRAFKGFGIRWSHSVDLVSERPFIKVHSAQRASSEETPHQPVTAGENQGPGSPRLWNGQYESCRFLWKTGSQSI